MQEKARAAEGDGCSLARRQSYYNYQVSKVHTVHLHLLLSHVDFLQISTQTFIIIDVRRTGHRISQHPAREP